MTQISSCNHNPGLVADAHGPSGATVGFQAVDVGLGYKSRLAFTYDIRVSIESAAMIHHDNAATLSNQGFNYDDLCRHCIAADAHHLFLVAVTSLSLTCG